MTLDIEVQRVNMDIRAWLSLFFFHEFTFVPIVDLNRDLFYYMKILYLI